VIKLKTKIIFLGAVFLFLPLAVSANQIGEISNFFIEPSYDLMKRDETSAVLVSDSPSLYFYFDEDWWSSKNFFEQNEIRNKINFLATEFEETIYPELASTFGSISEIDIDQEERITILIHPMIGEAGGYFNPGDVYSKFQYPRSNERKMLYLNSRYIDSHQIKSLLAHEFVHLITVNQKDLLRNVTEEIWLNEARAEYASTLVGYDDDYKGSNLERRVRIFLEKPTDSLTEWLNFRHDYGVLNIFTQYLVDQYGVDILVDSLHSNRVGIESINFALDKNGFDKDFSQIFQDWTLAILLNDCSFGEEYCYLNENLKRLRVNPALNFLPLVSKASLKIEDTVKDWSGRWYKLMGGKGDLQIVFSGVEDVDFRIFYVTCLNSGICDINNLKLNKEQKGLINVSDFGENYNSITLVISTGEKTSGFGRLEMAHPFSFEATTREKENGSEEKAQDFLTQINYFKLEVVGYEEEINKLQTKGEVKKEIVQNFLIQINHLKSEINECEKEINKLQKEGEIESEIVQELLTQIVNLKSRISGCEEEINKLRIIQEKPKEEPKERENEISLVDLFLGAINDSRMARFQEFLKNQRAIIYIAFRFLFL